MKRYKHDVNPDRLVTRHLRLQDADERVLKAAMADLEALKGVQEVTWHAGDRVLNLVYDPGVEDLHTAVTVLDDHGLVLEEDWHMRLAESLSRIEESLTRSSLGETPPHTLAR
jgi:hypothetical protein